MPNYQYPSAEKNTKCYECSYWHWNCPDAIYNTICVDFNLIWNEEWDKQEKQREMDETRIQKILRHFNL